MKRKNLGFLYKLFIYQRCFETHVAVLIEVSLGVHFKQAVMWTSIFPLLLVLTP